MANVFIGNLATLLFLGFLFGQFDRCSMGLVVNGKRYLIEAVPPEKARP